MERIVASGADMDNIISKCTENLLELLDRVEDIGIEQIVEMVSRLMEDGEEAENIEKLQSRKLVLARMLAKSLQAGDPIFEKVSRAVFLAARGVVLGGSGPRGRK